MQALAELRTLIKRHATASATTLLPGLRVASIANPTALMHYVCEPAVAFVAQGAKRGMLGDKVFEYGAGQYFVASVDVPMAGHVVRASEGKPFLATALVLKPALIATLLLDMPSGDRGAADTGTLAVSHAPNDLLDAVVRMLRLFDRPHDIAVLAPMIEREILWRLLCGEQGALVRQIGLADSRLSQIGRALRWIRVNHAKAFHIEQLAEMSAMSPSSFHRHFRAVTSMSPLQYQKQIRLQEARSRLLAESHDVAAVGFSVGYDSPSQFSREYSRLFGAPPARDAARLKMLSEQERSVA